ncbi:uncharacterized protein HMPREF1541_07991 [Cyphellophora europaea CBS 101466]|uniref:CAMK protein kinase n=1 Tax=Cyphellophora europaea (strain CBS 101466) TaxID=1220924 RepID=W2RMS8_CYPE1|nr:uncharacterized protein HMPREF1541_07991 [Cyphellophora europaea CBS 101466]ETN37003.1 hypothetical protein HMPREF1541_07991 [Cyphellophora europaea CBS 101466]
MAEEATQQATQPAEDPRKAGRHLSDVSAHDLTDVICLLHPQSNLAQTAVRATMITGPQHIHQNEDLDDLSEFDLSLPQYQESREFALRLSSTVRSPRDGFIFGRNPNSCDVLLTDDPSEKLISNKHFKIYVNAHGSLMLQDLSTNGTIVDDQHLRARRRDTMQKPPTLALKNGTIISVVSGPARSEVKFMIRIPNRSSHEDAYERNLRKYLEMRGTVANFASMRESMYGNHWNGGDLYNFTGNLGKGAFASVYRVQTKRDGYIYAAKELDKRRFIKGGVLDIRFDNELKIMQNLKHPNIVEYVDCQFYDPWVYIIMEYIPHGELSAELRARSHLPEAEVQQITRQILHALYYLHQRGVTHRDIKPDNILIANRDPLTVKLSDFGLSKCVTDQETFLKTFCGTLLYCAPEIYPDYNTYTQGSMPKRRRLGEAPPRPSPYDESVDMWSFGAVIFHLLCGKAPIAGRGDDRGAQMLSNIMTKDVDFEPLRRQGVSANAAAFIAGLLNRDPFQRPKEPECLRHPWLVNVPDLVAYEDVGPGAEVFRRALEAVDEAPDEDLDANVLEQLSQDPRTPEQGSSSPQRAHKRVRASNNGRVEDEVRYPSLPTPVGSSVLEDGPPPTQGKLFGEITPSVLKSSGVFGMGGPIASDRFPSQSSGGYGTQMHVPAGTTRDIQYGMENISVNDWRNRAPDVSMHGTSDDAAKSEGPSPSVLGAQIEYLNVTSPPAGASDVDTPETTNPATPHTRGLTPSRLVPGAGTTTGYKTQNIDDEDLGEAVDENVPPAAAPHVSGTRGEVGVATVQQKAETFQARTTSYDQGPSQELARTIDALTGREVPSPITAGSFEILPTKKAGVNVGGWDGSRSRRFGGLTSLPGSYVNVDIPLLGQETAWGRSPACTYQHSDPDDILIARFALKVVFHARGIEPVVKAGGDWTAVKGIETIISTSSSSYILINGVKLRKSTSDDHFYNYGKIYNGDIVTVVDETQGQGKFLRLKVEILFGDSARPRPKDEASFYIQQGRTALWKEHLGGRKSDVAAAVQK